MIFGVFRVLDIHSTKICYTHQKGEKIAQSFPIVGRFSKKTTEAVYWYSDGQVKSILLSIFFLFFSGLT